MGPLKTPQNFTIPRIVIAGTASGVGKTTIVVGLIAALRKRGLVVQPFKCGPDYIDPGYHTRAAGRPCRNLDSWMLDDAQVTASFARACKGADIAIIEGVMGLFDGCDYNDERASAAQVAKLLGAPVLLLHDISGAARSVAATVAGFAKFDPALSVGAVAFNFAGSESHALGCASAVTRHGGPPMIGWLPCNEQLSVPERHLGLILEDEQGNTAKLIEQLGHEISKRFDLDAVLQLARTASPLKVTAATPTHVHSVNAPLLAVARDEAFSFYYPDNLDLLAAAGARIAFFSPIRGERLPAGTAGVYLGGGYPELYARALSENKSLWEDLRALHEHGAPILAECGGFMVLTEALIDREGNRWPMAGLVPGTVRMTDRLAGLGYRYATALKTNLLAEPGEMLRGHEFHYSIWDDPSGTQTGRNAWSARSTKPDSPALPLGFAERDLLASYLHIHLGQKPDLASRFVAKLAAFTQRVPGATAQLAAPAALR